MAATIRRAVPADAEMLSELGTSTFVETFGHLYSREDLQAFLEQSHSRAAYAKVLANADYALWLAERPARDGMLHAIGYAQAGPCGLPHADVRPGDGELKRLYLRADAQNGGTGRALMDAAMAWMLHDGPRTLWISVWSENTGAQRFYARYGFEFAGEYQFPVGAQRDREFMFRRLPQS